MNLFYASAFDTEKNNQFNHVWCLVRPEHPRYTFASDIKIILTKDGSDLRNDIILNWFDLPSMLQLLSVIKPSFVLPHVFCCEGSTKLRYKKMKKKFKKKKKKKKLLKKFPVICRSLLEMINLPFIGSSKNSNALRKLSIFNSFFNLRLK